MINEIVLPKGLRIEVVDNDNLTVPVGTKATLHWDEKINFNDSSNTVIVNIDGDFMSCGLPFNQCKIIVEGESNESV